MLQHAGPKRHAASPEDRREAWAELRHARHVLQLPSATLFTVNKELIHYVGELSSLLTVNSLVNLALSEGVAEDTCT